MVARGLYGIRTWFYNRSGTGGWERYLPEGYPGFPGTSTTGQQGAFNKLNDFALQKGAITSGKIRDVWTGEPDFTTLATTLATLQTNLAGSLVGNCSNETRLAPPTYASCALPDDMSGFTFTAGEWTAVVNEMISEAYYAGQVVGHFDELETIRQGVFESAAGGAAGDRRRSPARRRGRQHDELQLERHLRRRLRDRRVARSLGAGRGGGQRGAVGGLGGVLRVAVGVRDGELGLLDDLRRPAHQGRNCAG